jgi:hypothetical protein
MLATISLYWASGKPPCRMEVPYPLHGGRLTHIILPQQVPSEQVWKDRNVAHVG